MRDRSGTRGRLIGHLRLLQELVCGERLQAFNVRNFKTEMERLGYPHRRTMTARQFEGLRLRAQQAISP